MLSDTKLILAGYAGMILLVTSAVRMAYTTSTFALPPLLPTIMDSLEITPFVAGLALSARSLLSALVQYPGGRVADQLSHKTVLVASMGALIAGLLLLVATVNVGLFFLALIVLGVGGGLYTTPSLAWYSKLYDENQKGRVYAINELSIEFAGIAASALAALFIAWGFWQGTFIPSIVVLIVVLAVVYWRGREPIVIDDVSLDVRGTGGRVFKDPRILILLVVYILFGLTLSGFNNFFPALLVAEQGFSSALASTAFGSLFVFGLIWKPIVGGLGDRFDPLLVIATILFLGALGIVILLFASTVWVVFLAIAVYTIGHKGFYPVLNSYLFNFFPDDTSGGDVGLFRATRGVIGAGGPAMVGSIASVWSYTAAFTVFVGTFVVAGFLALGLAVIE